MLGSTLAALAACGDDPTDPDGLMESAEAEAVMRSAEALPLLSEFLDSELPGEAGVDEDRARATLLRARELWDAGTVTDEPRAAAQRRLAVVYAVPVLVESVPPHEWVTTRERTEQWMATATTMLDHLSIPAVEARIEAASRELRRSDAARTERGRIHYLLLAGSELVETTPRFVARAMARDAEAAVREAASRAGKPLPEPVMERAERLKDWAMHAVEDGEYLLAIQRAYYAIQLVEGR